MPWGRTKRVACDRDAGFDRAVVDRVTGREVGGYCVRYERDEFGRNLSRDHWRERDGGIFCDRWPLPSRCGRHRSPRSNRNASEPRSPTVTDATIYPCDEHRTTLRDGDEPWVPAAVSAHR